MRNLCRRSGLADWGPLVTRGLTHSGGLSHQGTPGGPGGSGSSLPVGECSSWGPRRDRGLRKGWPASSTAAQELRGRGWGRAGLRPASSGPQLPEGMAQQYRSAENGGSWHQRAMSPRPGVLNPCRPAGWHVLCIRKQPTPTRDSMGLVPRGSRQVLRVVVGPGRVWAAGKHPAYSPSLSRRPRLTAQPIS